MIDWTARARAQILETPALPTAKTDETPLSSVSSVHPGGICEKQGDPDDALRTCAEAESATAATAMLRTCIVPAAPQDRPYRLSKAEDDTAHADAWDDAAIARFQARAASVRRRGFTAQDADDLAERLHLRDVHADYRQLCLECRHLAGTVAVGWRCGNHKAADVGRDLPAALVTMFQDCAGLKLRS